MIRIDEIILRANGHNEEDGNKLARQLSERLSEAIPESHGNVHIPEIRVRIQGVSTDSTAQTINRITEQIIREINLETSFA